MAVKLLQVLVLGVIAAAAEDDVPVTWLPSRALLPCRVPGAERIPVRRPPPPLNDDQPRAKPYLWEREGELLNNRVSNNGSLEVSRRKDPEGLYQCSTKFQGGKVLGYPVNLKFGSLDKLFSVQPANATAWRGQPYALTCSIASEPAAVISWMRNSKPLPPDSRYIVLKNQLLITEVTDKDAGLYKCRATNPQIGKSRSSHGGRLAVEDGPSGLVTAFLPVHQETSIAAPMGSRVVLACPVVGKRRPKLIWELTVPGERTAELEFESENLVWQNLQPDQAGVYSCRVHGHGHLVKTFNVTMTERVLIKHPPESKQTVRASTVRFNCSATGRPTPVITWYKDGLPLQMTRRIDILPNIDDKSLLQLLIRGVTSEDAGIYQCFASNSVSMASAWGVLNVTGTEAGAPEDLQCWPVGAYDVVLTWTEVPHTVIAYTVHTTVPEGDSFPEQPVTNTTKTIRVKSPLTAYGFQVRAYITSQTGIKNVASDMSDTIICQGQGVPIKLTKLDDENILISWQQFFEENPGVVQWILQHRVENGTEERNITLDGNVYNYTLMVSPLESIQVRVLGTRTLPWPEQNLSLVPWSSSADAKHQLGPGETIPTPINVEVTDVTAQNFTVSWQCEQDDKYAYLVCVRKVGGNELCIESYLTSAKVRFLEADTSYEVRVQAKLLGKGVGGDFSAVVMASTPSEEDVEYSYTSDGVEVRWRGAGPRSVHYTQNITQPMEHWRVLNTTTQTRVQITGLDPKLSTYVMVATPGPDQRRPVHTIKPPPKEPPSNLLLYISIGLAVSMLGLLAAAAACVWLRRKGGARRARGLTGEGAEEGAPKQKSVGGRLANGGGSRDAGEPLLNGHVHITENPSLSKTPNGKVRKGRYEAPFDVARYDGADVTLETVLDDTATTTLDLLDTSRRSELDRLAECGRLAPDASFNKLPDDNMNSEVTRSTFELEPSQQPPTLQPNG